MAVTSDEVNYLIYRYMQESGFAHSSFAFGHESHILKNDFKNVKVSPGALINLLQKGLLYTEAEMHMLEDGTERMCTRPFSLLQIHQCDPKAGRSNATNSTGGTAATGGGNKKSQLSRKQEDNRRKEEKEKKKQLRRNNGAISNNSNNINGNTTDNNNAPDRGAGDKMELDVVDVVVDGQTTANSSTKITAPANATPQTPIPADTQPADSTTQPHRRPHKSSREMASEDVHNLTGHSSEVFVCQWNPVRPNCIASGSGDATSRVWDLSTAATFSSPTILKHTELENNAVKDITAIAWNPRGSMLATGSYSGDAIVWTSEGEEKMVLRKHTGPVFALRWNKSGSYLLSAGADRTAVAWNTSTGQADRRFECHRAPVLDVDWRDDSCFASCSTDKTIAVCDLSEENLIHRLVGHTDEINTVRWDTEGILLASCSDDKTAKIWSTDTPQKCTLDLTDHLKQVYTLSWNPACTGNSRVLATASFDHTVKLWDIPGGGRCTLTLGRHSDAVYAASFTPDGKYIASGSFDGRVNVWNVADGALIRTHKIGAGVFDVCWNLTGTRLAACSADTSVVVMDIRF